MLISWSVYGQMLFEPDEVTAVRLVLLQPSPVWVHFGIEDVAVFSPEVKVCFKIDPLLN